MKTESILRRKIEQLHKQFGPQGWWPRLVVDRVTRNAKRKSFVVKHHPGAKRFWLLKDNGLDVWEIVLGAILTQNTAWSNVEKALLSLAQADVLTPRQIIDCPAGKLESLIKSAGYYKQKTKKLKIVAHWTVAKNSLVKGGFGELGRTGIEIDGLRRELLSLWGVGPETADTILLYGFGLPVFVVDTYTRRLLVELSGDQSWLKKPYDDVREFCESSLSSTTYRLQSTVYRLQSKAWQETHALIVKWGKVR